MNLQPGENAPKAGTYSMMKKDKKINSVHMKKGDTLPPTPEANCHYEID